MSHEEAKVDRARWADRAAGESSTMDLIGRAIETGESVYDVMIGGKRFGDLTGEDLAALKASHEKRAKEAAERADVLRRELDRRQRKGSK